MNKYIMRDILDKLETLHESTGLAGRKPGDTFRNPNGDEITFNSIEFYPSNGKLEPEKLDMIIRQAESETGGIQWMNNRSARTGGIAVASFSSPEGDLYYGRYLESIKPQATDNYVPNQIGDYRFAGKAAAKAQAGLSPQDLLTNKIDLSAEDIISQLAESMGTENPLYGVANRLAHGEPLPMTFDAPEGVSFSAFRDYFCEILQPIALQKGQYEGNAGEAAEIFLGGSFEGTLISFDDSKTAGLSDSIMTNEEGKSIKVSSKGGKGATASTSNLINSVDELAQTPQGQKLIEKYSETIDIMREIQKRGQAGSPLYLGMKYDIIDEDDARQILELKKTGPIPMDKIKSLGLSETLEKLAHGRKTDNPTSVNLYYHLMAAVAHKAAEEVNDKTDFSKAAADILNNGALVQVYTKAKEKAGSWTLEEFSTVYPGDSIKGVYLAAGKTYYSTGIKGNFTFKIDKGQGKPKDDAGAEGGSVRTKRQPTEKEFTNKAADIARGGADNTAFDRPAKGDGAVGRAKRKVR
jgi:hypothetical protein